MIFQRAYAEEQEEFEVPDREDKAQDYLTQQKENMHKAVQGVEARNRWKLLESSTPDHDISQLKVILGQQYMEPFLSVPAKTENIFLHVSLSNILII